MITRLYSAAPRGVDALEVEVEVNVRGSEKPQVIIVGQPDAAVRESSQRVILAISISVSRLADGTKTVNLALADLKKEGPTFDFLFCCWSVRPALANRCPPNGWQRLLPDMTEDEAIETTKIHSITGLLEPKRALLSGPVPSARPTTRFRMLASSAAETNPSLGEVSLERSAQPASRPTREVIDAYLLPLSEVPEWCLGPYKNEGSLKSKNSTILDVRPNAICKNMIDL